MSALKLESIGCGPERGSTCQSGTEFRIIVPWHGELPVEF
jgi:hypothetical protein